MSKKTTTKAAKKTPAKSVLRKRSPSRKEMEKDLERRAKIAEDAWWEKRNQDINLLHMSIGGTYAEMRSHIEWLERQLTNGSPLFSLSHEDGEKQKEEKQRVRDMIRLASTSLRATGNIMYLAAENDEFIRITRFRDALSHWKGWKDSILAPSNGIESNAVGDVQFFSQVVPRAMRVINDANARMDRLQPNLIGKEWKMTDFIRMAEEMKNLENAQLNAAPMDVHKTASTVTGDDGDEDDGVTNGTSATSKQESDAEVDQAQDEREPEYGRD